MCVESPCPFLVGWAEDIGNHDKIQTMAKVLTPGKGENLVRTEVSQKQGVSLLCKVLTFFSVGEVVPWRDEDTSAMLDVAAGLAAVLGDDATIKFYVSAFGLWTKARAVHEATGQLSAHMGSDLADASFSALAGADDQLTSCVKPADTTNADHARMWTSSCDKITAISSAASVMLQQHTKEVKEFHDTQLECARKDLLAVAGGIAATEGVGGRSWKEGLADDADWTTMFKHAESTLFRQKGLRLAIESKIANLHACLTMADKNTRIEHSYAPSVIEDCNATLALAQATMSEAAMLQLIRTTEGIPSKGVLTKVYSESQVLVRKKVPTSQLHPTIWSRMQVCLALA